MLVELFFRPRIVLVAATNLDFEKNKNFSFWDLAINIIAFWNKES